MARVHSFRLFGCACVLLAGCDGLDALGDGSGLRDSDTGSGTVDDEDTFDGFVGDSDEPGADDTDAEGGDDSGTTGDTSDTSSGGDTGDTSDTGDTGDTGSGGGTHTAAGGTVLIVEVYEGSPGVRKYVSLFNASTAGVSLSGWTLDVYSAADGSAIGGSVALSGSIGSGAHVVVVNDSSQGASWFSGEFGQAGDLTSPQLAFGGNDAVILRDAQDQIVDAYGVIGEQPGQGDDWNGEDSVWTRDVGVTQGNPTWTDAEWTKGDTATDASPFTR